MGGSQGAEVGLKLWARCRKDTCIVPDNIPISCGWTDRKKTAAKMYIQAAVPKHLVLC